MSEANFNPVPKPPPRPDRSGLILGLVLLVPLGYGIYWLVKTASAGIAQNSCQNHLKQIAVAILNYEGRYGSLPPAFVNGKDGKPAHSWRVLILPFLDHQDLYDAYHFDEPWNGPNNIKLIDRMPAEFACPGGSNREKGKTDYVAVVGSQTAWPGSRSRRLQDIRDGTSNTLLLTELAKSDITWTEPRDVRIADIIPYDADGVSPTFDSNHAKTVNIAYCDGSVRAIAKTLPRRTLYALLTADRGKPFKGEWLPGENPIMLVGDFPAEMDASALAATDVLPHMLAPVQTGRNFVYCATFQIAWDDFRKEVGSAPQVSGRPPIATGLNSSSFPRSALAPASYVARIGRVTDGIREKIRAEMADKFSNITPNLGNSVRPDVLIAYAFLQKNLPFAVRFDRAPEPIEFHAASGDVRVKSFGFKQLVKASNSADQLKEQVDVLHDVSDDEFILRLKPTVDEIILAKIPPAATLQETLQRAQKLISSPPKKVDRPKLGENDKLLIPRLAFNILRQYQELIGKHLENPGKQGWEFVEARESVRFLLNESGARLESEAMLENLLNGHSHDDPTRPRDFIFDRPFLLYLKERTAEQPYLVIWVANAELMERE